MIDLHSHILYGIDDGCKTINDALKTILEMKNVGFNDIVLTPHFIDGSEYMADNNLKFNLFNNLKKELSINNTNVNLYLGNEVYINDHIVNLIKDNKIMSINNSKYLLIELPLNNEINMLEDYIHEIKVNGYIPVIAHPERYKYFKENYHKLNKLYNENVLFQCNYGSIIKQYGSDSYKLIKYMLKNNMVTFLSTDVHHPDSNVIRNFDKIKKKIIKIIGSDKFNDLSNNNILKILKNQ